MAQLLKIASLAQLEALAGLEGIKALSADLFMLHKPDTHLAIREGDDTLLGRCSLWWHATPVYPEERLGLIGHFEAQNAEVAAMLLKEGCRILSICQCTLAVGPVDGNTWRRYRFITARGTEPPFFMEPDNPDAYPGYFSDAGFRPLARYYSNLDPDLGWSVPETETLRLNLERQGVRLRSLKFDDYSGELEKIYRISLDGFRHNFLYKPVDRDEFCKIYSCIQPFIVPELVWFAEAGNRPVGFLFAVPDMLRIRRGVPSDTVIFKSMAVLPEWSGRGIGSLLLGTVTEQACRQGFRRGIHALMHEANRSRLMSGHHGREFREYTLFCRNLP
ncbi:MULTISPECIES: GNAT family N-acetyltransferase [Syntrophotalea]|uniref:N-acetyltransferase domain-containing protein n=1 Tax=Syntrophotalea acetylenica TaxID=29542 RepID=A0A1L3GIX3_SYNAC|nr:GNAT family N-acetyltransferase [Syntrophotalea acetylenica]APG25864.1 hypothetical protein A7E75_13215 [Syntrophotalea acetylenica]APG43935.1 hypothetical protein A6070_07240 [Syntrophotalea acetylenica]